MKRYPPLKAAQCDAPRDNVAALVLSDALPAEHFGRLPPKTRDAPFAAMNQAASEVRHGVKLLQEGVPA